MTLVDEIKTARCLLEMIQDSDFDADEKEVLTVALTKLDPKDPVLVGETSYFCPECDGEVFTRDVYCPWCGQRLEWADVLDS